MPDFQGFLNSLKGDIVTLVETNWNEHRAPAIQDAQSFVEKTKTDLERWTKLLARGDLSREDFEWLVRGKKDVAEIEGLKQAGLALVRVDRFRMALLDTVIGSAFRAFS